MKITMSITTPGRQKAIAEIEQCDEADRAGYVRITTFDLEEQRLGAYSFKARDLISSIELIMKG